MSSTKDPSARKPAPTRLKLTMPSPTHAANLEGLTASPHYEQNSRRPSYSPVTPTFQGGISEVDARKMHQPGFVEEPDPIPLSLEENSDAIALKAAISILQFQKQQSLRDIKQLNKMKAAAIKEPKAFTDALTAGKLSKAAPQAFVGVKVDDETDDDKTDDNKDKPDHKMADSDKLSYDIGQFPNSQSVIRCPPINWAKYHIIGESLDKLHNEQRERPELGSPRRDEYGRPPEHVIAAPYRPFVDKFEQAPGTTRGENKE